MNNLSLIVDIGNTRTKLAVFKEGEMIEDVVFSSNAIDEGIKFIEKYIPLKNSIISSVRDNKSELIHYLKSRKNNILEFNHETPIPVNNLYKSPNTLGKDRLAGVIGANTIYPQSNVLVIDAGSAITYDFIHSTGEYYGGAISPGLEMRFRALHEFTSRLPKLSANEKYSDSGNDTNSSIISGVQCGMIFEINGYISSYKEKYEDLKIILTGGDAIFFDKKLKYTIFVVPSLILIGLNNVLQYNETLNSYYP